MKPESPNKAQWLANQLATIIETYIHATIESSRFIQPFFDGKLSIAEIESSFDTSADEIEEELKTFMAELLTDSDVLRRIAHLEVDSSESKKQHFIGSVIDGSESEPSYTLFREFIGNAIQLSVPSSSYDDLADKIWSRLQCSNNNCVEGASVEGLTTEATQEKGDFCKNIENQLLFTKFKQLLTEIGSPLLTEACQSIEALLEFKNSHKDDLFDFLNNLLPNPSSEDRQILKDAMHPLGLAAEVVNYYKQQDEVSTAEARHWIEHSSTNISTLVSTSTYKRRIFRALVDPGKVTSSEFFSGAFWFRPCEECHVFVVSTNLAAGYDRAEAICHELREMLDYYKRKNDNLVSNRKEVMNMNESSTKPGKEPGAERGSFVRRQMHVAADDKEIIAQWISRHYTLRDGAGIVIDAGSACLAMWEKIIAQICDGEYSHMVVLTNSMLVLENWGQWRHYPGVQRTSMELTGTKLDWEHLAFYGEETDIKMTKPDFRAVNVYIGTSGIEFDKKTGIIRFGCLGPASEPQLKKRLFECHASRRIILATPHKMGFSGARAFNILDTENLYTDAPIYLVTTNPEKGSVYENQFNEALSSFQSEAVEKAIASKGLEFHWVTIDRDSKDSPKKLNEIVIPGRNEGKQDKLDTHERSFGKGAGQQ